MSDDYQDWLEDQFYHERADRHARAANEAIEAEERKKRDPKLRIVKEGER